MRGGHTSSSSAVYPFPSDLEANLRRFAELGLATAITEVDVRMVLPEDGVPTREQLRQQADYYRRMLRACWPCQGAPLVHHLGLHR